MPTLWIRGIAYVLAAIVFGEGIRLEMELAADWRPFTEFGYLQVAQSLLLFGCAVLLFYQAWRGSAFRELAACLGLFFLILLVRENDQPLELFLPHGSWKYIALVPLAALVIKVWRNRRAVTAQVKEYAGSFAFGVMASGMLVLVFSRLFGRASFWEQLMGDGYIRKVKMVAEEGIEFLAMGMIFIAVFEFMLLSRAVSPKTRPEITATSRQTSSTPPT